MQTHARDVRKFYNTCAKATCPQVGEVLDMMETDKGGIEWMELGEHLFGRVLLSKTCLYMLQCVILLK